MMRRNARLLWRANTSRRLSSDSRVFKISEEVQQAIADRRPVVALESTIYTHGFPYPQNMVLATNLESIVRSTGAVPATVGVLDGIARVGLDGDDLIRLASSSQTPDNLLKVSRRDLSFALSAKSAEGQPFTGGTTVAGTMILASMAGIKIFATGGLGGVHRGASESFDISADLTELGRTPVNVIAAGCKAFLDIPKTLEYLETQGVAVATLADGRSGNVDFPGFWSRDSGTRSPITIQNEKLAAEMILTQTELGLQSGILFGNPVPQEHEIPLNDIRQAIDSALAQAAEQGMTGNKATPFILAKIKDITGSRSVATNTALVEHNVRVGAKIAMELAFLEKYHHFTPVISSAVVKPASLRVSHGQGEGDQAHTHTSKSAKSSGKLKRMPQVFVAGMLAVDFSCDYKARPKSGIESIELHTSNPAHISQSLGGVGHNVARTVQLCDVETRLLSAIGCDLNGTTARTALEAEGLNFDGVATLTGSSGCRTAQYVAVNDEKKDLVVAMADMSILERHTDSPDHLEEPFNSTWAPQIREFKPTHIVVDANWSPEYLGRWFELARQTSSRVVFEPVSRAKATGVFNLSGKHTLTTYPNHLLHIATPNEYELASMYDAARDRGFLERKDWWEVLDAFGIPSSGARAKMMLATSAELVDSGIPQQSVQLLPFMPCIMTKLGARGVLVTQIIPAGDPRLDEASYAEHMLSRCTNGSESDIKVGGVYMRLFPPNDVVLPEKVISVNGVGDTFVGVVVAGLAKQAQQRQLERVEAHVDLAQRGSVLTLKSREAVSPDIQSMIGPP